MRNVRNFWIEANVDGRDSQITGGPQGKDGGFSLTIYQRDGGGSITAVTIEGLAHRDGELGLTGSIPDCLVAQSDGIKPVEIEQSGGSHNIHVRTWR